MKIELSWPEIRQACEKGLERWYNASKAGRSREKGRFDLGIETHVSGAIGELAISKFLDVPYEPSTEAPDTDIGDIQKYQVKAITIRHHSLIIRQHDNPNFPFVLIFLDLLQPKNVTPYCELLGWINGKEARQSKFLKDPANKNGIQRYAYFVPQNALHPISTLPNLLEWNEFEFC